MEGKVEIFNPANKPMHYDNYNVGILNPPDKIPQITTLSSYKESEEKFCKIQNDLYVSSKKAKPKEKGFPLILKILTGFLAVCAGVILGFKYIPKLFLKK